MTVLDMIGGTRLIPLGRQEGIFAGTSTGGNVAVALRIAERLGPGRTVVTVACDSGMKYLSTPLYADARGGNSR